MIKVRSIDNPNVQALIRRDIVPIQQPVRAQQVQQPEQQTQSQPVRTTPIITDNSLLLSLISFILFSME